MQKSKAISMAAVLCGLYGIVGSFLRFIPYYCFISLALAILGIVLSVKGIKIGLADGTAGLATAGLVLSVIGVVFSLAGVMCFVICAIWDGAGDNAADAANDLLDALS